MEITNYLVLEDGTVFRGKGFGAPAPLPEELLRGEKTAWPAGEVVFNTGMCGYHEILTDSSYTGQIVTMTYPHIGNYGDYGEWSENGPGEAERGGPVKPAGLVVRKLYSGPVFRGRETLNDFLLKSGVPGISDVDTRSITLQVRNNGSPKGVIVCSEREELSSKEITACTDFLSGFPAMEGRNLVNQVGTRKPVPAPGREGYSIALLDCGVKANILRELERRECGTAVYPSETTAQKILGGGHDAVLISNGPGDPAVLEKQIEMIRKLMGKLPVFGICLGHQLIALALGARTYKMKFGHHGVNHPVRDEFTRRVFVTSQNHGFSVDEKSLPEDTAVWFRNANDGTVEGLAHTTLPVLSAQFHPESAPGPDDSLWIFDRFLEAAGEFARTSGTPRR